MDSGRQSYAICSFFIPGLGQAFKGEYAKAAIFLIGDILLWSLVGRFLFPVHYPILLIIYRFISAYEAYR